MEQKIKKKSPEQALASLQRICSRMERSKNDIRISLYRYGLSQQESEKVISKLESDNYINEKRYANCFVREKSSLQKWSERRIRQSLKIKGIPDEYIDEAILENIKKQDEENNLEYILNKRYEKIIKAENNIYTLRRKLFTYAANKGYDIDKINDILDKLCQQ